KVGLCGDRRRTRAVRQQRDLAEVVAGSERAAVLASDRHPGLARLDHEEPDAALTFGSNGVSGTERALLHRPGDPLELPRLEAVEERDALEKVGRRLCHASDSKQSCLAG